MNIVFPLSYSLQRDHTLPEISQEVVRLGIHIFKTEKRFGSDFKMILSMDAALDPYGEQAQKEKILRLANIPESDSVFFPCRNTIEEALETERWTNHNKITLHHLILITHTSHRRRASYIFSEVFKRYGTKIESFSIDGSFGDHWYPLWRYPFLYYPINFTHLSLSKILGVHRMVKMVQPT